MVFNATFNNISVISWRSVLLMEETWSTWRKPPTCRKSLTNFITQCCIKSLTNFITQCCIKSLTNFITQCCIKSLTNFITQCCIEYTSPWMGFELTNSVVIGTDSTGSCKSNYQVITITTINVHAKLNDKIKTVQIKIHLLENLIEWVNDSCLMPNEQFFSYMYNWRGGENKLHIDEIMMSFLFFLVLCTLCCQFLWIFIFMIAPSVFSDVYCTRPAINVRFL
jgi:hypothetical protein